MLLEIKDLIKEYRNGIRANDGISLSIEEGEVFGLLGPNGAGKSTLVNQIIGLLAPTSGTITLDGTDIVASPDYGRASCSYQPQGHVPIDGFTPAQAIELIGRLRGGSKRDIRARTQALIDRLDIREWADRRGQHLSGGVRRLVGFAMAVVCPARLVILDEPTNDIDPLRRRLLWAEVTALAEQGVWVRTRRSWLPPQSHVRLGRHRARLVVVARNARAGHVLPHVRAALGARHDVIEG